MIARALGCAGVLLLFFVPLVLQADSSGALSDPPSDFQAYTHSALTTVNTTVSLRFTRRGDSTAGPSKTLIVKNDGASGTADIYINIHTASTTGAAAPTNATVGDNVAIKAGETLQLDGTFELLSMKAASGTQAVRVIWSR